MLRAWYFTLAAACIGVAAATASADEAVPQAFAEEVAEGVITVRAIDQETRDVKVEDAAGNVFTVKVPPEAQNLAQVRVGARFKIRYRKSVAVFVRRPGSPELGGEGTTVEQAPRGANPAGTVVTVRQAQGRVEAIDYRTRTVVLSAPEGGQVEITVDERVQGLENIKRGDLIVVRYTEAVGLTMIEQ